MNGLKICFSIFLLLILLSCSENKTAQPQNSGAEKITFIGFSNIGGQLGYYKIIKITEDSIHFETGETVNKKHKKWNSSITPETWKKITSCFKIKNLDSIRSSPSIQVIDGIDESFQIKTTKKSHVYVNAQNDIHYRQFEDFKNQILSILPKEYQ